MITVDFHNLPKRINSRILDIGCGTGRHTAAAYALEGAKVVGADPNMDDLQEARSRLQYHHDMGVHGNGHWSLSAADIKDLPFADRIFNLVICSEVLEHIPEHSSAIREIIRVLKPGCDLVISVPRGWPEKICWALSPQYRQTPGGHIRIYKAKKLIGMVQSKGLIHWRSHYAHSLHTPFWWLKCLVGPQRSQFWPVRLYNRFLTWDMMHKPRITSNLDRWLNPLLGKSLVLYFRKPN